MGSTDGVDAIKRLLSSTTSDLQKSFARLAAGSRITSSADDAAGQAIADALGSDAAVYSKATDNIGDAQSLTDIQSGVFSSLSDITTRQQELATESANGTLSDTQRQSLNQEYQSLSQEASRIVQSTQFNGQNVFSGDTAIQVGTDSSANSQITVPGQNVAATVAQLQPLSIDTQANAQNAINSLQNINQSFAQDQGNIGAVQSRLSVADSNVATQRDSSIAAESRIRDLDYASETANNVALQISQQTSTALLAQASNLNANIVQRLLT